MRSDLIFEFFRRAGNVGDSAVPSPKARKRQRSGGGAATSGGMEYQYRVAAWAAGRILAEQAAALPWDLPSGITLESVRCEASSGTSEEISSVDDIVLGTSAGGQIFIQSKRTLQLGTGPSSEFAKTIQQFVGQFLSGIAIQPSDDQQSRELDIDRDRLVIAVNSASYAPIRTVLPSVLTKVRRSGPQHPLDEEMNEEEKQVLAQIKIHIDSAYQKLARRSPEDHEVHKLLKLMRITVLDVETDGEAERNTKDVLGGQVLKDPVSATAAWSQLVTTCAGFCSTRSGGDRSALQEVLINAGIELQGTRSYWRDIALLRDYSRRKRDLDQDALTIGTGSSEIRIQRSVVQTVRELAEEGGIIVGEAGAGKTAALIELFDSLVSEGRDVIFLSAGRIAARSVDSLQHELGLDHSFVEVLENWPGSQSGFVLIDALDAARLDEHTAACLRDLIAEITYTASRWRVVAVIRKFDLRFSAEIQNRFRGTPAAEFADPEFQAVRHVKIGRLTNDELDEVKKQSPELALLIGQASPAFLELLRTPLHLQFAGELLASGVSPAALTPIRAQLELLDKYWQICALGGDGLQDAREAILTQIVEQMLDSRELRALRRNVTGHLLAGGALGSLLTSHVLVEWQQSETEKPDRDFLSFAHHVVFDYAVARLQYRHLTPAMLEACLGEDRDLVIATRPSLVFHLQRVWAMDLSRTQFWELVLHLQKSHDVPEIGKIMGAEVAASQASRSADFGPLLRVLEAGDDAKREVAEFALDHLTNTFEVSFESNPSISARKAEPWCELAVALSNAMTRKRAFAVRQILWQLLADSGILNRHQLNLVGDAARRLLEFAWTALPRNSWLVRGAITAVCRTFIDDPHASANLLRRAFDPDHLSAHGYEEMPVFSHEVRHLWRTSPAFVEEIYRTVFAFRETSQEATDMSGSQILALRSTRKQDYEMACYRLAEEYPDFLSAAPEEATRAMVSIIESYAQHEEEDSRRTARIFERMFADKTSDEPDQC